MIKGNVEEKVYLIISLKKQKKQKWALLFYVSATDSFSLEQICLNNVGDICVQTQDPVKS